MILDENALNALYALARIEAPTSKELAADKDTFNELLQYIDILQSIDTSNVEPFLHPGQQRQRRRDDVCEKVAGPKALLGAARLDQGQVVVPKVVD